MRIIGNPRQDTFGLYMTRLLYLYYERTNRFLSN